MNRLEARIRDYLADHLELIGQGLEIVAKEYELKNKFGAGGFVDVLARDQLGHLVVMEIKRSDQTARSAIHELTKYVALLRADQGLRRDQIRAVLVSTDWHELAVPFSEYLKIAEVPTEGFAITTDTAGIVTSVAAFETVEVAQPLVVSRSQDVILFSDAENRNRAISRVTAAAERAGLLDFVLLRVDYEGDSDKVIYPHGIYLVFSSPFQTMTPSEIAVAKEKMTWEDDLEEPDENFLVTFREVLGTIGDDSEIGYPEKLGSIASSGWRIAVVHRSGRYASNAGLLSDEQVIADAKRIEGGAAYYLVRTASPKYTPSWEQLKEDAKIVLLGDPEWAAILPMLLAEIERRRPTSTVSVYLYNTAIIVFGLAKLFKYREETYFPSLQIIVADVNETVVYLGMLAWNGQAISISGEQWLKEVFGSIDEFMMMQNFRETHQQEARARRILGLSSVIFEIRNAGTKEERGLFLNRRKGRLARRPRADFKGRSMLTFASRNRDFGLSLVATAASFSLGWVS